MLISRRVTFGLNGQVEGDLTYFNGSDWARLPAGSTGQFLHTMGTTGSPQWVDLPTITPVDRLREDGTASSHTLTVTDFFSFSGLKIADVNIALWDGVNSHYQALEVRVAILDDGTVLDDTRNNSGSTLLANLSFVKSGNNLQVNMVFTPPWDQSRMSDEARVALDMW